MRRNPTKKIEKYRETVGAITSDQSMGPNGKFVLPCGRHQSLLCVIASDGTGWRDSGLAGEPWEHVSVSAAGRCPTWAEMEFIKRIFWRDDEVVIQLHVPRLEHVSYHEYCLHLWKPSNTPIPRPPSACVGPIAEKGDQ